MPGDLNNEGVSPLKQQKILIITGRMDVGGIENQLMHLLRQADKEAFQIDFTSTIPDGYYRAEIEALRGKYIQIPPMSHRNPLPYCRALYRVMKDGQYDIVHSHELFHSGIVLLVAKIAGVPCRIAHAHNWQDHSGDGERRSTLRSIYNHVMRQLILRCSTRQIACSTLAGKFLYGEKTLATENYHLVFNSVDTEKHLDRYDQRESGEFCGDGWANVLQVGRVTKVKNQLFLTEIAKIWKKQGKQIRILCAGNGDDDYLQAVHRAIAENGLESHIQMLGVREDIDVLMRKASAFVLPSQYEGMPLVLIEAQASGLPCVVADTFSREVDFGLGRVRWLNLEAGAEIWAEAIETAIAQGRALKEDVIRIVAEKGFDSREFARKLCQIYESGTLGE